jgi:hypothetical protein
MDKLLCHPCCVETLRMREAQLKLGKDEKDVMVRQPNEVVTFEIQLYQNMPVSVPVCIEHLSYKQESRLTI